MSCIENLIKPDFDRLVNNRKGEVKLGERISVYQGDNLNNYPCKYAVVGIPEDIGVRANFGRPGAELAWESFLPRFLNLQSVGEEDKEILFMGALDCEDLNLQSRNLSAENLSQLVSKLDQQVELVITEIVKNNMIPIVIGGGHNNAFPILKSVSTQTGIPCGVVNIDPHADLRETDRRHSGNGFSFALEQGYLGKYTILGFNERSNNAHIKSVIAANKDIVAVLSGTILKARHTEGEMQRIIEKLINRFENGGYGIELDLDSIAGMPSSAMNPCGLSTSDVQFFMHHLNSKRVKYFHISEGAPAIKTGGEEIVGKFIAQIICDFIDARRKFE